jgi:hypothetical protein
VGDALLGEPQHLAKIAGRYLSLLGEQRWLACAAGLAALLVCSPALRRYVAQRPREARRAALVLAIAGGVWLGWSLCWASDDAYISFRYARNWARGEGVVFNPGERVEGYTDFLWTAIAALAIRLGAHPAHAAILLSLASFVALIALVARLAERLAPRSDLPLALGPLLVAVSYTVASFATSALETVFASALVLLAVERADARRPLAAGTCAILATLAHPDHALFYAALAAALLLDRERRAGLWRYALPFAALFVPYFLWRWSYYGDPMPNTYYAKSADEAYVAQGLTYFWLSFLGSGLWAVTPLALAGLFAARRTLPARFALIALPLYVAYVVKIGGDFMLGRLYVPVLALGFLFADVGLRVLLAQRWRLGAALAVLASLAVLPIRIVHAGELLYGVADERTFTPVLDFASMRVDAGGYRFGRALHDRLRARGLSPRVGVFSIGMAGYEADLPVFDLRGLTSRAVAHMPIAQRGRPGHEKTAQPGHLLQAGVDLAEIGVYPAPYDALTAGKLGAFNVHLMRYEPALVRALRRGGSIGDFPRHVDRALPVLGAAGPDRLACDLWQMGEYYFSRNADPRRRAGVAAAAVRARPELAGVAALLFERRDLGALGYTRVRAFSFDDAEPAWSKRGDAEQFTRATQAPQQSVVFGNDGPFVNTFARHAFDRARGALASPEFTLQGDVLAFRIGGGFDPERLALQLVVAGETVRSATGCNAEWLGRRVWDVRAFRGRPAQLVIVDGSAGGFGHLLVDEIVEWRAPAGVTRVADAVPPASAR